MEHTNNTAANILSAKNIHKHFAKTSVLKGIDFAVRKGELVSIMGPSGSGKSTLLYCLAGITTPDDGEIVFNGDSFAALSRKQKVALRRTDFGFIFQFGELVPELPVRDNIALPLLLRGEKKAKAYSVADKWIALVGLEKVAHDMPQTLSGGETQRAAIVRAMAINPKIIFADEPTGSLDEKNSKKIMTLLVELAKTYNTAVVFVTHNPEVATYADRQVVLRDGVITPQKD